MPLTHKRTNPSSFSRSLKHILKALGGATVSMGATFSLFLTSAQAASLSYVTTFETDDGAVTLEWSGKDTNKNDLIEFGELSGDMVVGFGGATYDLGPVSTFYYRDFTFNKNTSKLVSDFDIGSEDKYNFWFSGLSIDSSPGYEITLFDWSLLDGEIFELELLGQSTTTTTTEPWSGDPVASTPEPTLTLGLITLGGLMLGSRKKVKA